jgi:8-amino-7-oxononanoate synthase
MSVENAWENDQPRVQDFEHFGEELHQLDEIGRRRRVLPRQSAGVTFEQQGQTFINFGSNDYLGLASNLGLTSEQASKGIARGSGSSALVCGWTTEHDELAKAIATFESTESAILFPSGYAACSGVAATLPGAQDLILSDALNHASLIDGCRLSRADCLVYPHRDCEQVKRLLIQHRDQYRKVWLITDSVFSMDGHLAPLPALCDLADRYDAYVLVDEAHGTGVLGTGGSGVCEELGVKHRIPIRVGTLSKALGSQGGFVAGPAIVIDYLINRCRSLIYSTALAPPAVTAALDSLNRIASEPWRRDRVRRSSRQIRQALEISGDGPETEVPIIPWIVGDEQTAIQQSRRLWDRGVYVPVIRPPTVPQGSSRLRISVSADHTDDMLEQLIDAVRGSTE